MIKFKVGDQVELCVKDEFVTSTSVQVGDKGQMKDSKKSRSSNAPKHLVCFDTHNGPRNQWVYDYHIKHASTDTIEDQLMSQIKGLEEELHEKRTMLKEYRKVKAYVKGGK